MKKVIAVVLVALASLVVFFGTGSFSNPEDVMDAVVAQSRLSEAQRDSIAQMFEQETIEDLDKYLENAERNHRFHGGVLVGKSGRVIFEKAYGSANPADKDTLEVDDVFQLASVSKQFTSVAIMMLKEQGKINFDDSLRTHIPELPDLYDAITIRHLLNHTSGLPEYFYLLEAFREGEVPATNDDVIRLMSEKKIWPAFKPGVRFKYRNTNYALLASIVERLSGKSFSQYVKDEMFTPLGMKHTFVYSHADDTTEYPEHLAGYQRWRRTYLEIPQRRHDGVVGDKNVYSNLKDLLIWDWALQTNQLVSATTMKEATTPAKLKNGNMAPYGFGFRFHRDGRKIDTDVIYHPGLWNGFRTNLTHFKKDSITVVVLTHTQNRAKGIITKRVEEIASEEGGLDRGCVLAFKVIDGGKLSRKEKKTVAKCEDEWLETIGFLHRYGLNIEADRMLKAYSPDQHKIVASNP